MRSRIAIWVLCSLCGAVLFAPSGRAAGDLAADLGRVRSRLEAMGHEYHSKQEWGALIDQLDDLAVRAQREGRTRELIEVNLLQAMVAGDILKNYRAARDILEATKEKHASSDLPVMRRVYGRLAEVYGKLGEEAAVNALIEEFRHSPAYDPEQYSYSGGFGPREPVVLERPSVEAQDSITVTAMEKYRAQARLRPGAAFPEFAVMDRDGMEVKLSDYRGKVLLLDFWVRGWVPWERGLPYLVETYHLYRDKGFEILGVCLDRDPSDLDGYLHKHDMTWRQIAGNRELPARYGIYGEATNFLLDRNGVIIGRDLTGSDLVEALKSAL